MIWRRRPRRKRRRAPIDAALLFVVVLLVVQMWLLTATLESYLAGHVEIALPAFLSSAALFAVVVALYRMVIRLDRSAEAEPRGSAEGPWLIE